MWPALLFSNSARLSGFPSCLCAAWEVPPQKTVPAWEISRSFSGAFLFMGKDFLSPNFLPSIPGSLVPNPGTRKGTRSGWYWLLARRLDSRVSYSAFLLRSQGLPATPLKRSQEANAGICCGTQRALVETTKALMSVLPRQLPLLLWGYWFVQSQFGFLKY